MILVGFFQLRLICDCEIQSSQLYISLQVPPVKHLQKRQFLEDMQFNIHVVVRPLFFLSL